MKIELPEIEELLKEIKELRGEIYELKQGYKLPWITRDEFMKEFGYSASSCRNLEAQGLLTPKIFGTVKPGKDKATGKIVYSIAQINDYLSSQK